MQTTDVTPIRRALLDASDAEILALVDTIRTALAGDSNDAEHDALVDVAEALGIERYDEEENE